MITLPNFKMLYTLAGITLIFLIYFYLFSITLDFIFFYELFHVVDVEVLRQASSCPHSSCFEADNYQTVKGCIK